MKLRSLIGTLAGFACMLLLAGSAMAQGGELVSAEWGVPGAQVDVTSRVRTFVRDGILQFEVTRFNLGIDPAPHRNKVLTLHVRHWGGDIKEYAYPERSTVSLELDPEDRWERREEHHEAHEREERREEGYRPERGLLILRAYYGAEGQFMNVTEALRSRVDDGRLFLHVDNYSMGGDPLPGRHKWLRVLYVFNGERRNVVVDERTDLQLP
jgi:DnaJ-like protein C11, C-terminal